MLNLNQKKRLQNYFNIDKSKRKLLVFDLYTGGHRPCYIKHLIQYWCSHSILGELIIVVSPEFTRLHTDVSQIAIEQEFQNVKFVPITDDEYNNWHNQTNSFIKVFQEWQLFCKYSKALKAHHSLVMYLDYFQLHLMLGFTAPCNFSGIYFRPAFHYSQLPSYQSKYRDIIRDLRQKFVLAGVIKNKNLRNIFCLDPFAVKYIKSLGNHVNVLHLPDPIDIYEYKNVNIEELKISLGIEAHRKVFLLFGRLDKRKGVYQLLEGILQIAPDAAKRICILLVGEIPSSEQTHINLQVKKILETSQIQIIKHDNFIPDSDIPKYFKISDVVLAPYQHHVGMSGILLHAAAALKPVLSSDYGLMGQLVNSYQLGLGVDTTLPDAIADGIMKFMTNDSHKLYSTSKAQEFASKHHSNNFAETLIQFCN